ncbi:MAG: HAMP domain-containing sensor histidine kinase, partial [Nonlabens ulvanivorans]|uniref:sensor histidine kinase n=1 Tax=Nonlabens ulvanivorans TaxID=906888 RepID=UPI0032649327
RRANKNMAELTNALLLLSRKDAVHVGLEEVNLKELSTNIIDEHRYLLIGKNVNYEVIGPDDFIYELPVALCRIVLSNLIRNAFEHTVKGTVKVEVYNGEVCITNSISGFNEGFNSTNIEQKYDGFGIGLDIVNKVVKQQDWQLSLVCDKQKGGHVRISFKDNN